MAKRAARAKRRSGRNKDLPVVVLAAESSGASPGSDDVAGGLTREVVSDSSDSLSPSDLPCDDVCEAGKTLAAEAKKVRETSTSASVKSFIDILRAIPRRRRF